MVSSPYDYINATGVIVPDTSEILTDVQADYQAVLGADLIVTPDTPQGVLITAQALAETAVVNNNAALANQINPKQSGGVFLDAVMSLTGIERIAQTKTLVTNVSLAGVAGTIIPFNSQAMTAAGDIFQSVGNVTLSGGGTGKMDFQALNFGATPCADGALTQIVSSVLGWETVTNNQEGTPASVTTLGRITQSDQGGRAYRKNTMAYQGVALAVAITSALYAVTNVTSLSFRENYEGVPAGALISVTGGATLSGTIWGMTTTGGTGTGGGVLVGTDAIAFALSLQSLPGTNPWPVAAFTTTANIALTGLGTQAGGDWSASLTAGNIILAKNQTDPTQNGIWVAASGAWARQAYNTAGSTILGSMSGISMKKNSIYTCVAGGTDLDVAAALLENKSSGCAWNGNNSISIIEPASGQSYGVQFDRPAIVSYLVRVTTTNGNAANIQQVILDWAAGNLNGFTGNVVGSNVSAFDIAGAINSVYPAYYLPNVEISLITPVAYQNSPIAIGLNQQAFTQLSYITVNIT